MLTDERNHTHAEPAPLPPRRSGVRVPSLRWIIAVLLFLAAALNYIDRSVLGQLAPTIQKDLAISDKQYAGVVNAFLVAYTIAYLLSGRLVDKIGERASMLIFIAWWTVANALTGFARSLSSLTLFRFLLGLGEAGGFTVAPKVVSLWFPASERGLAVGVYSIGGAIGATVAPLIVATVASRYGWRWVFAVTPVLASMWIALWLTFYRRPAEHPMITDAERDYLAANVAPETDADSEPSDERALWAEVLRKPLVWRLMLSRLLTDPVWYFFQFWMAKYLFAARGFDQKHLSLMWTIFLAADIGFLAGGFFSGRMIGSGSNPPLTRLRVMAVSACLVPFAALIPLCPSVPLLFAVAIIAVCAHTAWLSNVTSLIVDIVPKRILATAFGLIACGSAVGGIFMNQAVATLVGTRGYDTCFYLMVCLHPLAFLIAWPLRKSGVQALQSDFAKH